MSKLRKNSTKILNEKCIKVKTFGLHFKKK